MSDAILILVCKVKVAIPLYGAMAHSIVQAHDNELSAFEPFARSLPKGATLLIDTWDTEAAAGALVPLALHLAADGIPTQAVRLDSGDLGKLACRVRQIFDDAGLRHIRIFASSDLDENSIKTLINSGGPIDGFDVGIRMNVSADYPYPDCAYKLVEFAGPPRCKRSEGKVTWPGQKRVYRYYDTFGRIDHDLVTRATDSNFGAPLLAPAFLNGQRLKLSPNLKAIRMRARTQIDSLPQRLLDIEAAGQFPVEISLSLQILAQEIGQHYGV